MATEKLKLPSYGGQALIEGVLMRGSYAVSAAMRDPKNEIIVQTETLKGIYQSRIRKWPFFRGLILLWDALGLGMRYLTISANVQSGEDEKIEGPALYLTMGISLAIGIAIFFIAPAAIGQWSERTLGWNPWISNLFEGIIRVIFVIGYIWGVGHIKEVERVFAYHGAEHKTINAYEAGAEMKPEEVTNFPLEHPRCGTSFILTLALISILLFTLLGPMPWAWRLSSRVILLPVLAGISYEYIRWTANHLKNPFIRFITKPNLALQRLTTREPGLDMLVVSISAFNTMIELENKINGKEIIA
jgi:uncharacterized protein YqhQ